METTKQKYVLQKTEKSYCPVCESLVSLFCPANFSEGPPAYYLCFGCGYIGQVGVGPVTGIGPEQQEPKKFEGSKVDVEEIDDLLDDGYDPDSFVGKKLIYHDNRAYRLMKLPTGRLVAAISHRCEFCHRNPVTVFHGSGLHNGAWCYGYGFNGELVANFRDQNYVCAECAEARENSH